MKSIFKVARLAATTITKLLSKRRRPLSPKNTAFMLDLDAIKALIAAKKKVEEMRALTEKLDIILAERVSAKKPPSYIGGQWMASAQSVTYTRTTDILKSQSIAKLVPVPNVQGNSTIH